MDSEGHDQTTQMHSLNGSSLSPICPENPFLHDMGRKTPTQTNYIHLSIFKKMHCIYPKYLDIYVQANSADPDQINLFQFTHLTNFLLVVLKRFGKESLVWIRCIFNQNISLQKHTFSNILKFPHQKRAVFR